MLVNRVCCKWTTDFSAFLYTTYRNFKTRYLLPLLVGKTIVYLYRNLHRYLIMRKTKLYCILLRVTFNNSKGPMTCVRMKVYVLISWELSSYYNNC